MRPLVYLVACLTLLATPLLAHDLGLAQIELTQNGEGAVIMRAKLSATVEASDPVVAPACVTDRAIARNAPGGNQHVGWTITCPTSALSTDILLPWALQAAMVAWPGPDGQADRQLIQAGQDGIRLPLKRAETHTTSFWHALAGYTSLKRPAQNLNREGFP